MGGVTGDDLQRAPRGGAGDEHPVLAGLVAFVAVVAVVAGVLAGGTFVATKALGLSDDPAASSGSTVEETLFLPRPSETDEPDGPAITLPGQPQTGASPTQSPEPTRSPEPEEPITLLAGQSAVGPMEQIDLTGQYPTGEGSILRVQQFEGGTWTDFPVTASVSGGGFSTFIQTGAVGLNRFRMLDTDTGATSNEVRVQIG
jgi:hypothetical protein